MTTSRKSEPVDDLHQPVAYFHSQIKSFHHQHFPWMEIERNSVHNAETGPPTQVGHTQMPAPKDSASVQEQPERFSSDRSSLPVDGPPQAGYAITTSLTQTAQPKLHAGPSSVEMHNHQDFIPNYFPLFQCHNLYTLPCQQYCYNQYNQSVFAEGSGVSTLDPPWYAPPLERQTPAPPMTIFGHNLPRMQDYAYSNHLVHQGQDACCHEASHRVPFQAYVGTLGPSEPVNPGPIHGSAATFSLQNWRSANIHLNGGTSVVGAFDRQANPGNVQSTSRIHGCIAVGTSSNRLTTDTEFDGQTILVDAQETVRFYEYEEWHRTNGWSPLERLTMLDKNAVDKWVPGGSPTSVRETTGKITTIYVVLLHHVPTDDPRRAAESPRSTATGPTPCFMTKGDVLHVIQGEDLCRNAGHEPPLITHKWEGKTVMCGFRRENGRTVARVIRGEQDVGTIYKTIERMFRTQRPVEQR